MMKKKRRVAGYLGARRIWKGDIVVFLLLLLALLGIRKWKDWYDIMPSPEVELVNPYLAQADSRGNTYIIDNERSRIVKLDEENKVEYLLKSNLQEADTFWYAEDVAASEDGTVYVLDASWDETGSAVARECILVYSPQGDYQDTILDVNYTERVNKHQLFALTLADQALYYVNSESEGFSLCRLSLETGGVEQRAFCAYEGAFDLIQDYAVDTETETVYALDKRGKIVKGDADGIELLYDTAADPAYQGQATFYRIAAGADGTLYIADIRQNRILSFQEGSKSLEVWLQEGEVLSVTAATLEDGSTELGLCLDGGLYMRNASTGETVSGFRFAKTEGYLLREGIYQAAVVLAAICSLWLAVRAIAFLLGLKLSKIQQNGLLAGGTAAVVAVVIVSQLLGQFESVYRDELMNRLHILASTVSGLVDGDSLEKIKTSEDYMGEDYQNLMDALDQALNQEDPSIQELYCNVLRYEDGQGFAIAYLDNSIGTYYPRGAAESEELAHIYETGETYRNDGAQDETGSYIYISVPVMASDGRVAGVIEIGTTSEVITGQIDAMRSSVIITLIVVVLMVMFLFGEILSFFDLRDRYKKEEAEKKQGMPMHLLRLSIFVTYMAFNVASSFLSVYAAGFATDALGIPRELAASLPITLNLIFVGITSLFCAGLLRRFSFRAVAAVSGLISMAGDSLLFLSHSYWLLVLGLILNGIGMGLITNSISMFIAGSEEEEVKENGFSLFNAGSLSGINVGMMFGASLAGALGQRTVFLCSACAWLLVAVLFLAMGKHMASFKKEERAREKKKTGAFLLSRGVVPYMLLVQFPYVIINSFVFYYVPIYGDAHGLSESIVSLLLMLNSLCSVYLSVSVTNYVSRKFGQGSIYLSTALSLAALLLYGFNDSIEMMIFILLILGVAASFGTAVRQVYFSRLPGVPQYGEESAMGIYSFMDNIGESAGPMLFGSIMSAPSVLPGLAAFAGVSAVMNGLYAAVFGRNKKQ